MKQNFNLILGSGSSRRKELLEGLGYTFEVKTKEVDETFPKNTSPKECGLMLAKKKADALKAELNTDDVLLCADTIVELKGRMLAKPESKEEAKRMLRLLSNHTHSVVTAFVAIKGDQMLEKAVETKVTFKALSEEEIEFYIDKYQPYDKAGSYGIQEWIGYIGVKSIQGSYFNVVGLPVFEVHQALQSFN